jgi:hypothetical protein
MSEAVEYQVNSIKCEPSGSGYFAIRTNFDDEREWKVISLGEASHYATHDDVSDWADMEIIQKEVTP